MESSLIGLWREGLVGADLLGSSPRPVQIGGVPPVQGMVDDDLPPGEELDVWTADALVRYLFVLKQVVGRDNVEGLAHRSAHRPTTRAAEAPTPIGRTITMPPAGSRT